MFMGHLGLALGTKRLSPKAPLWVLLVASVLPDLADAFSGFTPWHAFVNEYSHSLYGIALLALGIACVAALVTRDTVAAVLAALLVVSHLLLDFTTSHISLWPTGPVVGAGLYGHPAADFVLELAFIIGGVALYSGSSKTYLRRPEVLGMLASLIIFQIIWDVMLVSG